MVINATELESQMIFPWNTCMIGFGLRLYWELVIRTVTPRDDGDIAMFREAHAERLL